MLLRLQGVDGLTGNADEFGEFFLRPVLFCAQDFEAVFHKDIEVV